MGPTRFNGSFGESELRHLLRRTMYGATSSDVQSFEGQTLDQVVDTVLADQDWPSPPVNNYAIEVVDPHVAPGEVWVDKASFLNENGADQAIVDARNGSLIGWLIKNMIAQQPTVHHKMTMFWHNHFGNSIGFVSVIKMSYQYFRTMWQLGLGNFNDLIKAITIDPHMLIFLNGAANIKEAPDENFARELPVGPTSHYWVHISRSPSYLLQLVPRHQRTPQIQLRNLICRPFPIPSKTWSIFHSFQMEIH